MKVRVRDDESSEDLGTWTICFPIRPVFRREPDEEGKDEPPASKEDDETEGER